MHACIFAYNILCLCHLCSLAQRQGTAGWNTQAYEGFSKIASKACYKSFAKGMSYLNDLDFFLKMIFFPSTKSIVWFNITRKVKVKAEKEICLMFSMNLRMKSQR